MSQGPCCPDNTGTHKVKDPAHEKDVRDTIRRRYGDLAKTRGASCCEQVGGGCRGSTNYASTIGYTEEQLTTAPKEASGASAGCGNPTAIAQLKEGEVVLDLGSGGGLDVFLAAKAVGPSGKAIGVDMTPEMIELARLNAEKGGFDNVEFRLGEIEHLPVPDESVDVIISNCVINLSVDKGQVFREAHRVLRGGGRLVVSDIMAEGLPDDLRNDLTIWAKCIGGAVSLKDYLAEIRGAGFREVEVLNNSINSRDLVEEWVNIAKPNMSEEDKDKKLESVSISHAEIRVFKL
jgi:arsenite methyltransferase